MVLAAAASFGGICNRAVSCHVLLQHFRMADPCSPRKADQIGRAVRAGHSPSSFLDSEVLPERDYERRFRVVRSDLQTAGGTAGLVGAVDGHCHSWRSDFDGAAVAVWGLPDPSLLHGPRKFARARDGTAVFVR